MPDTGTAQLHTLVGPPGPLQQQPSPHDLNHNVGNGTRNLQYYNANHTHSQTATGHSTTIISRMSESQVTIVRDNNNPGVVVSSSHLHSNSNDQNNNSSAEGEPRVPTNVASSSTLPQIEPPDRRDFFEEIRNGGGHWSQLLRQVVLHVPSEIPANVKEESLIVPLEVDGGSENGQFSYVGQITPDIIAWIAVGYLHPGDIILDIQGQQVAGYTQADVTSLLQHCLRGNSATLTVAPRGSLGPELRSYLNTRFQKGSVDHALQGVVRDNLYLRTVPVTTRPPRPGEINDVDYTFLSVEEFMELERNGSLLESGVYAGNHYGTPKPWANRARNQSLNNTANAMTSVEDSSKGTILPGMHPSSEGKRKRNRSNVEALGVADDNNEDSNHSTILPPAPVGVAYSPRYQPPTDELGPLPSNWEMAYTDKGEVYFIDHNTGTSHWLDPRLSRVQKMSLEECDDNELPFGWERIDDPHYGTYYIDHVNRRTQFENPVLQAKQGKTSPGNEHGSEKTMGQINRQMSATFPPRYSNSNPPPPNPKPNHANRLSITRGKSTSEIPPGDSHSISNLSHSSMPNNGGLKMKSAERSNNRFFTRDPTQLMGEKIGTTLVKSSRGLGFTIVGGDDDDGLDEFLQIKSVVADGPAWRDGKLRTGDVLVRVSGRNVLGYTHQEMVSIFQSISPGEEVHLEVCRGYPLPFDPSDPNTEIVTTVAVAPFNADMMDNRRVDWTGRANTPDSLAHSAHSLPELSGDRGGYGKSAGGRPASVDLLLDSPNHMKTEKMFNPKHIGIDNGTFLTVAIIKGTAGFGFTIADSVNGQKVKKVLDPTHCGGLEEGDRLIAIDGIDLRGLSHAQVVQILKDFPLGRDASLTIQRVHSHTYFNKKFSPLSSNEYSESRLPTHRPGLSPRSKTPTAEMGRSRPRLRDTLPERPKTPVFDSHYNGLTSPGSYYDRGGPISPSHTGQMQTLAFPEKQILPPTDAMNNDNGTTGDLNANPNGIREWLEMSIELHRRQEGFGFRIVGGTEEGSQVSVGHIVPRGAASVDGRLQTNDQLIAVDGISVVGASHHSVVQLMARAAAAHQVRLTIRRPIYNGVPAATTPGDVVAVAPPSQSPGMQTPLHVILKRLPSEGFGFVIISSASKAGATIGRIVEGSPADRYGQLHVGDRILAVNQTDISQLHHSQVVQLIKDSGLMLTLTVLPVQNNDPNALPMSQLSPVSQNLETMTLKESHSYDMGTAFISPEGQPVHFGSNSSSSFPESVDQIFSVHLSRGNRGFGFSIRGGKEFQNMPLFVLRLAEDGPASGDGRMQVGDQILQINGISTQGMAHSQAIHLIKTGGASVHLLLRRGAVPIPYLNQMPNFSGGTGSGFMNGHEEIQSVSSNNDQQFMEQTFRDVHRPSFPPQM